MKGKGIHRTNYLPDCIQHGFMALWLELSENKGFLNDKTRQQAVFYSGQEPMLQEVRYEFSQVFLKRHNYTVPEQKPVENRNSGQFTSPYQNWREQYQQGHTEPADALVEQYRHTVCIARAIRAQIDGKTYRQVALDIGCNPNMFPK
jgi:hypothetical protein